MEDNRDSSKVFVLEKVRIYEPENSFTAEALARFEEKDIFRDESRQFYFTHVLFDLTSYPSRGAREDGREDYEASCESLYDLAIELFENGARGIEDVVFGTRDEKIDYFGLSEKDEFVGVYRSFTRKDVDVLGRALTFLVKRARMEEYRDQLRLF